jgi:hypothetical protein
MSVVEWPGGEPKTIKLQVSETIVKTVLRGGNRVLLDGSRNINKFAALPWGSRVGLHSKDGDIAIYPAQPLTVASPEWDGMLMSAGCAKHTTSSTKDFR